MTSFAGRVHDARVKYLNKATSKHDYGVVCTDLPLLPFEFGDEIGYFEVEIVSFSGEGYVVCFLNFYSILLQSINFDHTSYLVKSPLAFLKRFNGTYPTKQPISTPRVQEDFLAAQ